MGLNLFSLLGIRTEKEGCNNHLSIHCDSYHDYGTAVIRVHTISGQYFLNKKYHTSFKCDLVWRFVSPFT